MVLLLPRHYLKKLKREEQQTIDEILPPEKHLSFKIDSFIDAKIENKVEAIRKFRSSFSKKQWILEAIEEKLDIEEKNTELKSQEFFNNMLKEASKPSLATPNK